MQPSTGRANCWVCGRHSLAEVVSKCGKMPLGTALSALEGMKLDKLAVKVEKQAAGRVALPSGVEPMGPAHRRYLRERGFNDHEIESLWQVEGIGISAKLGWRLFIPIVLNGEVVSWTSRAIGEKSRYLSASLDEEKVHHKETLYGIDLVRTTIIVSEGPTDAWNIGPSGTCMFGLKYTPSQVHLIAQFPNRVICLDSSSDAQKVARDLCETLSLFPGRTTNVVLDAEDPGSADRKEIKKMREAVL